MSAQIDSPLAFAAAFSVSRETLDRLQLYAELLHRWSKVQDLVAPATLPNLWHRHFADSAQLLALAPDAKTWLDLGTGAGFPGLVVAIMITDRPGVRIHLVESNARKCAFLRDVARRTAAPVEIHNGRIESLDLGHNGENVDVVTARALAPLVKLVGLAQPFFSPATTGLVLKGREWSAELAEALKAYAFEATAHPSLTDPDSRIIALKDLKNRQKGE
jgi:16S rRNA (guanine527-N7)-methyltransferase